MFLILKWLIGTNKKKKNPHTDSAEGKYIMELELEDNDECQAWHFPFPMFLGLLL